MKKSLVILCLISLSAHAQVGKFNWLRHYGDSGNDRTWQIANDGGGNVYLTGSYHGQLVFGADTLTTIGPFAAGNFLAKFDSNGIVLWADTLPVSPGIEIGTNRLRVSPNGVVGVAGDGYLALFRDNGDLIGFTDAVQFTAWDMDFDMDGSVYLAGTDPFIGYCAFAKYDSLCNIMWTHMLTSFSQGANVNYYNDTVYVVGQFLAQLVLTDIYGAQGSPLNATSGLNDWDLFIGKYTTDGHLVSGVHEDGPVNGASGELAFAADFDIANRLRMVWCTPTVNDVKTKTYSLTLQSSPGTLITALGNGSFPVGPVVRCSEWENVTAVTYLGLAANGAPGFIVDSVGAIIKTFEFPSAGGLSYMPYRPMTVDSNGNIYVTTSFIGGFQYNDSSGIHSANSVAGSEDFYLAKVYTCLDLNASITVEGADTLICTTTGVSYQWYFNSALIPGATAQTYIATQSGNYTVIANNAWGCIDSAQIVVSLPTEVNASPPMSPLSLYPNPTSGIIHVPNLLVGAVVSVANMWGKVVLYRAIDEDNTIDLSVLPSGVYYLSLYGMHLRFLKL